MGRVARGLLRAFAHDATLAVTLLAAGRDARALRAEFPRARIASPATARRRGAYDVVWYPFNGMRFASVAPSVVTIHDAFAFTEPHPERIARLREQGPIRRAARRAAKIVTVSAWSRDELARELGVAAAAIAVIPSPPDAFFSPGPADLPPPLATDRFVLVVGAGSARKNARLALEACALALCGSETLVIAGRLSASERALARGLRLRCGELEPGDELLRALYRKAVAVLVPSRAEGFGLVAVEALACGAAVLAAEAAALPEATRGAAILLPLAEPERWAHAIRRLLDEPERLHEQRTRAASVFAGEERNGRAERYAALLRETAGDGS